MQPLVTHFKDKEGQIGKRPIRMEIDYLHDLKQIQSILEDSKRQVQYLSSSASIQKLGTVLDRNPLAIHYCGHGVKNNEANFGSFTDESIGDYLLFEDEYGGAEFLSCKALQQMLSKLNRPIQFVFVASCHSKLVGEVFLNAGALHVICVKRDEQILDSACLIFAKAFYHACLIGKKTICEAFEIAKSQVQANGKLPLGEQHKFILLINKKQNPYAPHNCIGWLDTGPGIVTNVQKGVKFDRLPPSVENFLGRNVEMFELITLILSCRLVTIKGIPGIGKSTLTKEVARYLFEREHFKDGIVYLQLNGYETTESIIGLLDSKIHRNVQLQSKKENNGMMLFQIVECIRSDEVLIIFDNCDLILANSQAEKENFLGFIDILLSNCNNVHTVFTTRIPLTTANQLIGDAPEKIYNLAHLNDEDAKNLLLLRSPRMINQEEISELLATELAKSINKRLLLKNLEFAKHPIFDYFQGHPQAITLVSALLDDRSLKELYYYLNSLSIANSATTTTEFKQQEQMSSTFKSLSNQCHEQFNIFSSLKMSLDLSWKTLAQRNDDACKFFALMGLLPSGVEEEDFEKIWGKDWEIYKDILLRSSLLIKLKKNDKTQYRLYPFMTVYAEEHLTKSDKVYYHRRIVQLYSKKFYEIYQAVGTQLGSSFDKNDEFISIELNIRACIFRELTLTHGQDELEKSLYANLAMASKPDTTIQNINQTSDFNTDQESFNQFNLSLTKQNLDMHQRRYKSVQSVNKKFKNLSKSFTVRSSTSQISTVFATENMANKLGIFGTGQANQSSVANNNHMLASNLSVQTFQSYIVPEEIPENPEFFLDKTNNENDNLLQSIIYEKNSQSDMETQQKLELQPLEIKEIQINADQLSSQTQSGQNVFQGLQTVQSEFTSNNNSEKSISSQPLNLNLKKNIQKQLQQQQIKSESSECSEAQPSDGDDPKKHKSKKKFLIKKHFESQLSSQVTTSNSQVTEKEDFNPPLEPPQKPLGIVVVPTKKKPLFKSNQQQCNFLRPRISLASKIIFHYITILILSRRYTDALKLLHTLLNLPWLNVSEYQLFLANLHKLNATILYIQKNFVGAIKEFEVAENEYRELGCSLGIASCNAGVGYMKYLEGEFAQAKLCLEDALKIYDSLTHKFGMHFLHRWLANVKNKIKSLRQDTKKHIELARNVLKNHSKSLINKHKGGVFILRWAGDAISIFIEESFVIDCKPVKSRNSTGNPLTSLEVPNAASRFSGQKSSSSTSGSLQNNRRKSITNKQNQPNEVQNEKNEKINLKKGRNVVEGEKQKIAKVKPVVSTGRPPKNLKKEAPKTSAKKEIEPKNVDQQKL